MLTDPILLRPYFDGKVTTIHVFIFPLEKRSKTDDPVIISSLAFNSETKISADSLCPTILIYPILP